LFVINGYHSAPIAIASMEAAPTSAAFLGDVEELFLLVTRNQSITMQDIQPQFVSLYDVVSP
jgi:hypothetical protein